MTNRVKACAIYEEAIKNKTMAKSVLSSITQYGSETRLDSIYWGDFPKMVMVERNRQNRGFPYPITRPALFHPEKLIEEIRSGVGLERCPQHSKYRIVKGMGGGDEFPTNSCGQIAAQLDWIEDALDAADAAERD